MKDRVSQRMLSVTALLQRSISSILTDYLDYPTTHFAMLSALQLIEEAKQRAFVDVLENAAQTDSTAMRDEVGLLQAAAGLSVCSPHELESTQIACTLGWVFATAYACFSSMHVLPSVW